MWAATRLLSIFLIATASFLFCCLSNPEEAKADEAARGVPFITLRARGDGDDPSDYFGEDRGDLTSGWCGVGQTDLSFLAPAAKVAPFRIPEEILDVEVVEERPRESVLADLQASPSGQVLLYVHGYYIDFEKGCRRATIFKENAGLDDRFLWFSWPSAGNLVNYARDELNVAWSAPDLAGIIIELHAHFGDGNVDIAGHSLGGRGLTLALYEVANTHPEIRLGEIAFLAPDIDFDLFRKLLPRFRPLANSMTVYTSSADAALVASAQLHGYPRLGQSGNDTSRLSGVNVIDTTDLPFTSANGHLYHIYNKEVGADLNLLVTQGVPASDRETLEHQGGNAWRLRPQK